MPNVTISVPDQLKADMDKLSEVNWSEICRKAISRYIAERKNPTPNIELDLREVRLDHYYYETGYPTLTIPLRIHNKMESEITVDRILFNVKFLRDDGTQFVIGSDCDLYRRMISSNSVGEAQISLTFPKEKIEKLKGVLHSTFYCHIRCVIFLDGFRNPYNSEIKTRIPIDDWDKLVKEVLKPSM
ncbi:MAG: ribbon-helix-helix domain-containing protein [Candidatus Bathyarchaeota archaeon]|nr:ribbon-helix-helix domain-containing protein [Candidatus Bathyarchaeota archaeon]MDH5595747.1 ribbon-helix-helix domain-containing protein [Candidatus Bathyarchaeota archaeon]